MQKKLIAMAVAGLVAAPAFAQSNVTIYGIADAYVQSSFGGGQRDTGLDSGGASGSRIGFKGTEDLGNGLKGLFVYEFGTSIDGSTRGIGNTRQSYVGLSGKFGTVVGGRLQTPGKYASDDYDISGTAWYSPLAAMQSNVGSTINGGSRLDNAVAYISPSYYGVTATVAYSFNEETTVGTGRGNIGALGLKYANGPLSVTYVWHTASNIAVTTSALDAEVDEHFLGASYDFGKFAVMGSAQVQHVGVYNGITNRIYNVGGSMKVGAAGTVLLQYASLSAQDDKAGADGYALGYFHSLSKRTDLYAGIARMNNDKYGTTGLGALSSVTADANATTYGFGMRHKF